jgi:hypothetical protein
MTRAAATPLAVRGTGGDVAEHCVVHAGTVAGTGDGELGDRINGHD